MQGAFNLLGDVIVDDDKTDALEPIGTRRHLGPVRGQPIGDPVKKRLIAAITLLEAVAFILKLAAMRFEPRDLGVWVSLLGHDLLRVLQRSVFSVWLSGNENGATIQPR